MAKVFGEYENSGPPWDICPHESLLYFVLMLYGVILFPCFNS